MKKLKLPWTLTFAGALLIAAVGRADVATTAPDSGSDPAVAKWIQQLGAGDSNDRDIAEWKLQEVPYSNIAQIEKADAQPRLAPEVKLRLDRLVIYLRARASLRKQQENYASEVEPWIEKQAMARYDQDSNAGQQWDSDARKAISLQCRVCKTLADRERTQAEETVLFTSLLKAGCLDSEVLLHAALFAQQGGNLPLSAAQIFRVASHRWPGNPQDPYGGFVVVDQLIRATAHKAYGDFSKRVAGIVLRWMTDRTSWFRAVQKLKDMPPALRISATAEFLDTYVVLNGTHRVIFSRYKPQFDEIYAPLEKAYPNNARVLAIKGKFYIDWAWVGRGYGWAADTSAQQWADFNDRLNEARKILTHAYELDPSVAEVSAGMVTVSLGLNLSRDTMETWYKRALTADPDNSYACMAKLEYLEPKWHGSIEEMLKFGHECADHGSWAGRQPQVLASAYVDLAALSGNPKAIYQREDVWNDLSNIYSTAIRRDPNSRHEKSVYAYFSALCGHWKKADELFKELGNQVDPSAFDSIAQLQIMQEDAAKRGPTSAE